MIDQNRVGQVIDYPKDVFAESMVELGRKNNDVLFISCDTSLGMGASEFKRVFPERHLEFGIQEQSAVTQSAGLALSGKIPYIGAHVPFITYKCMEQIRDDLCIAKLNVNIVARDFGWQFPSLGPTHMVFEDIGLLRTLPNITIIAPADGPEYRKAILDAADIDGPVYIRLSRQPTVRINSENFSFKIGKGNLLKKGSDVTLISTSTMVCKTVEAARVLEREGINAEVLNIHTIKPLDESFVLESSSKTKKVVTIEEHNVIGGLGSAVAEVLIKKNPVKMKIIGLNDCFSTCGESYDEILDYYGFTGPKLAKRIKDFLGGEN